MKVAQLVQPRSFKDLGSPVWVIAKVVSVFLFSQIAASLLVVMILSIMHPGKDPAGLLDGSIPGQFFFVLMAEGLAAGLTIFAVRQRRLPLKFIGLGRRPKLSDLGWGLVGVVAFYLFLSIVLIVLSSFLPHLNTNQQQQLGFNNIVKTSDNILAFLALVIVPPFGEEPLMRGYLFSGLRARMRFWPAALIASVLFGIAHLEFGSGAPLLWAAGIDTFILSLVLVYLRESTGALYAGILVHLLNNLVAFGIHFH